MCSEWRTAPSRRSRSSAFCFNSSTVARLNVQTLMGSYVALSTRPRAILPGIVGTAPAGQACSGDRIAAEDANRLGLGAQRLHRRGDRGVVDPAFEVAEEHVAAEAAA